MTMHVKRWEQVACDELRRSQEGSIVFILTMQAFLFVCLLSLFLSKQGNDQFAFLGGIRSRTP